MPTKKAPENMTLEELEAHMVSLKVQEEALRASRAGLYDVHAGKVHEWHVNQANDELAKAAEKEGRTPEEQARYWLTQDYRDVGRHVLARRFLEQRVVNGHELDALREADNG